MRSIIIVATILVAVSSCDATDSTDVTDTGTGTDLELATADDATDTTETGTETGTETETETGQGNDEPFWLVLDQANQIVGRLATPRAEAVIDHSDVFSTIPVGGPRTLYLTLDSWGFALVSAGPSFWPNAEPSGWVWYSDASCGADGGHPFDTYSPAKVASDCVDEPVDGGNYPDSQAFGDLLELRWPGAAGVFVRRPGADRFWRLPADQEWPAMLTARSALHDDDSCTPLVEPVDVCALRLQDATYWPISNGGPYTLIEGN